MQNVRKKKEKKIKKIDTQIQNLKSDIEKNKDVLNALEEHKKFLVALPFPNLPTWLGEQEKLKKAKYDKIKKEWIDEHKRSNKDDHIIFREEEEVVEKLGNTQKSEAIHKGKKGGQNV